MTSNTEIEDVQNALASTPNLGDYKVQRKLGIGKACNVYLSTDGDGRSAAIKYVPRTPASERTIPNEVCLLRQFNHDNVVKFHAFAQTEDHFILVLDFCEKGDLFDVIFHPSYRVTEEQILRWTREILEACQYLHEDQSIAHRDLKLENIAISEDGSVRLIDFEYAAYTNRINSKVCGTERYLAPEMVRGTGLCDMAKADVWAVGIVLTSLLAAMVGQQHSAHLSSNDLEGEEHWNFPWSLANVDHDDAFMVYCSTGDLAPRIWSRLSAHMQAFVRLLLTVNPSNRPSAAQAIAFLDAHWPHLAPQ